MHQAGRRGSLDDAMLPAGDGGHGGGGAPGSGLLVGSGLGSGSGSRSFSRFSFDEGSGGAGGPPAALFCVLDGHCGRAAAQQAAQLLPRELTPRIDPRQLGQVPPRPPRMLLARPERMQMAQTGWLRVPLYMPSFPEVPHPPSSSRCSL